MFIINLKNFTLPTSFMPAVKGEVIHVSKKRDLSQLTDEQAMKLLVSVAEEPPSPDLPHGKVVEELWSLLEVNKADLDIAPPVKDKPKAKPVKKNASVKQAAKESGKKTGRKVEGLEGRHMGSRKEKVWTTFQGRKQITLAEVAKASGFAQDAVLKSFRLLCNKDRCGNRAPLKFEFDAEKKAFKAA